MLHFQTFADAQEYLAKHGGGEPFDYARDAPNTRERADWLGVLPEVEAAIEASRAMDETIDASVKRAQRSAGPPEPPPMAGAIVEPLPGFKFSSIWGDYTPPGYLVKRVLGPGELTVLFGRSGHFKSVVAVDLALCVASGRAFHGLKARRGGVLYVAGEGHMGIRKRMRAWALERGLDESAEQPALYVTNCGADLIGFPAQLRATVDQAAAVLGIPIDLVVIDTLAANFGAGDENHATEMTLAIANARRAAPGAATLLIHHSGHGEEARERGSSALAAAADYRLQAVYDEAATKTLELKWLKVKDDERPEPLTFDWKALALGWKDDEGEELTSVVLERLDGPRPAPVGPQVTRLGKNQEAALKVLRALLAKNRRNLAERGDDPAAACILIAGWRTALEDKGMARNRFHEVFRDLQDRGLITVDGPHVRPVEVLP